MYIFRYEWTPKGSYIAVLPGDCAANLIYSTNLVKAGSLTFQYQFPSTTTIFHITVRHYFFTKISASAFCSFLAQMFFCEKKKSIVKIAASLPLSHLSKSYCFYSEWIVFKLGHKNLQEDQTKLDLES